MITRKRPSKSHKDTENQKAKKLRVKDSDEKLKMSLSGSSSVIFTKTKESCSSGTNESTNTVNGRTSGSLSGRGESCNLSRRQASILSKRRAAEELELVRQQELEAEMETECSNKRLKKDNIPPPPPWSEADKDIFFQGVLAVGRDFDRLHKFCVPRMKIKDLYERSKDQIRHFYYRTVNRLQLVVNMKIVSKNKEANELFAVVNLAEFRRRTGLKQCILVKYSEKLHQLIYTGETKLKLKGKLVKVKTPTGAPLNRMVQKAKEDANKEPVVDKRKSAVATKKAKVPDTISVELQPRSNVAWHRVHGISHNPHLRLKVKCEQSLSTVIEAIEKKWVPSTVRFRKELSLEEEWDRLPYIKMHPSSSAKLQPFDLGLISNNTPTLISFNKYLAMHNEDVQPVDDGGESGKSSAELEKNCGDPVKFLKDKLSDITSQLQGDSPNGIDSAEVKEPGEDNPIEAADTKSHDWISQAAAGWTSKNSTDISMGCLYLLYGSPDKIVLEYEWPELENTDEVVHMFAGMINRLITIAEHEFGNQSNKRKQVNGAQSSPTSSKSPSTRGRKRSPSTPKTPKAPPTLKSAPPKESPEFKKPGVPLQSEGRKLADAIALGRQELRPYARRPTARPKLVQKNILPNHIAVPLVASSLPYQLYPKPCDTSTSSVLKTHVMDISCITSGGNTKYSGGPKQSTSESGKSISRPRQQSLMSMIANSRTTSSTGSTTSEARNELMSTLTNFINSSTASYLTKSSQLTHLQSIFSNTVSTEESQDSSDESQDILAQAMSSIRTPVKRRITPTMISPTVEGSTFSSSLDASSLFSNLSNHSTSRETNGSLEAEKLTQSTDSISEHSMSLLLRSLDAAMAPQQMVPHEKGGEEQTACADSVFNSENNNPEQGGPLINSFQGLISGNLLSKEAISAAIDNHTDRLPSTNSTGHIKDAWLTPDISLNDFSLSSLLGDKSPRHQPTESAPQLVSGLPSDRPNSIVGSDDTRMSFLNKLDVNDLGLIDSSFTNMISGDSVDYMAKFESLAATLETPQKKTT